ncbi:hypothetical protein ASE33_17925 [Pseudomonas sp. Root9]|nr:hypothetical protein ASE33_17925 [Pseudomonas sp. Root9]
MRYVRNKILSSSDSSIAKQRQLDKHRTNLFMVEISKRLVKIAKTAMILNGDGHAGMTQGDSLGSLSSLNEHVLARCGLKKPTVILTNPPFAGAADGRITDPQILDNFATGIKWTSRGGEYTPTGERNAEGVPPEMLFFERCLNWIAPGGTVGIVMPKSFLDTQTYFPARKLMFDGYKLLAVINCHKNTFQPHTGVRTCLLIIERLKVGEKVSSNHEIFLAISKKIGQDSEGFPIFRRDHNNLATDEVDHDLDDIVQDYYAFKEKKLVASEYRFSIKQAEIDSLLRINPQFYLPNLNETIKQIESIDGVEGWSVTTLGQINTNVRIFKGPRLKSENLLVEQAGPGVEPYYTPSAVLQEKSESAKLLDINLATSKQIATINAVRVHRGDIVISRSGTIGRVSYITQRLDQAIVSDDLIRVRIENEAVRLYVYQFLQSRKALNQMLKNEYGAVQQHLEPVHISDMLIPVPDNWDDIADIVSKCRTQITMREFLEQGNRQLDEALDLLVEDLISKGAVS